MEPQTGEVPRLQELVLALADRIHKQSELLSRKAEKKTPTPACGVELVCVYCRKPLREHDPSPHGGAVWRQCRDGTGRPVHLDAHFAPPPGARWCGEPNRARVSMVNAHA